MVALLASSGGAGTYVHQGVIQISVTNLSIIIGMIVVFLLALVLPFPGSHRGDDEEQDR